MTKLEKRVYLCTECALGYYKPLWEPMFVAKIMWKRTHEIEHTQERITNVSMDYQKGVEDGGEQERERIIKLLENQMNFTHELCGDAALFKVIALIKGENK